MERSGGFWAAQTLRLKNFHIFFRLKNSHLFFRLKNSHLFFVTLFFTNFYIHTVLKFSDALFFFELNLNQCSPVRPYLVPGHQS